jgi:threo-3-hydroxy-L-aspartate ammonia-lyase
MSDPPRLPTFEDVQAARARIRPWVTHTPVVTSRLLDERCGAEVLLKCESFQRTGSFKFRGALNALLQVPDEKKRRGVLTYSSGNHAAALAHAGQLLQVSVTAIMPRNAPAAKIEATRSYGATIVPYDPAETTREALGQELREARGLTLIPPYDHPDIVAGQGTAALELIEEVGPVDTLIVPCGGGGLLSGSALSARALAPDCHIVGAEPELADDAARSFHAGTIVSVHNPPTIADGLRTPSLGTITFPLIRRNVDAFETVTEQEIIEAVHFLWTRMKLVVEASGAVGAAPLVSGRSPAEWGARIGVIISGGNADLATLCRAFEAARLDPSFRSSRDS